MTLPPTDPMLLPSIRDGYRLLHQGHYQQAGRLAERLVATNNQNPHVLAFAAEACMACGDARKSLRLIDQAAATTADKPFLLLKKARLLALDNQRQAFIDQLDHVLEHVQDNPILLWQSASLCHHNQLHQRAIDLFEQASRLMDPPPGLLYELAMARHFRGDAPGAEQALECLLRATPHAGPALYLRSTLKRQSLQDNHIRDLEQRLATLPVASTDRPGILYALAKELEDCGDHTRSFAALTLATREKRASYTYDIRSETAALAEIAQAYTQEQCGNGTGHTDTGPIFIVGMPRSGTTLCERLLCGTSQAVAAGELHIFGNELTRHTIAAASRTSQHNNASASLHIDFRALGQRYVHAARQIANGSKYFVDKLPGNFMFCGMIARALPQARIIHVTRDPLDNCYAIHKTQFFDGCGYACDLTELGDYFIAYRLLMDHWQNVMPGKILEVPYEDLVRAPRDQSRRMYAWCGLDWNDKALLPPPPSATFSTASAAQVREPIHQRSLAISRNHLQQLSGLEARLAAAGIHRHCPSHRPLQPGQATADMESRTKPSPGATA